MALPDTAKLLEQERRLMKPAGYAAVFGVLLFIASVFLQSTIGGEDVDTDAGLLRSYADDGSTLLVSRLLFSLAFLSFIPALYVLFRAAQARIPSRIRPAMVAFCFIGPVLLAVQAPVLAVGLTQAGDQFVEDEPALEAEAAARESEEPDAAAGGQEGEGAGSQQQGQGTSGQGQDEADGAGSGGGEVTTTPTEEGSTTTSEDEEEDPDDDPIEQAAEDEIEDNGTVTFARALLLPALLGMVGAMVYIPLWAMRAGLLTRFMASFGMALGVSLLILPFAQLALVFWFGVLGLVLLGRWIGRRPAAWDAGEAIPWPARGQPAPEPPQDPDSIEGSGRELGAEGPEGDDAPPRLDAPGDEQNGSGPNGGGEPRKRKRRR